MQTNLKLLPLAVLCFLTLQSTGNSQQFRSSRRVAPDSTLSESVFLPFGEIFGVADFNGDGRLDLLVQATVPSGTSSGAALMLQNSSGTFTQKQLPSNVILDGDNPLQTTATVDLNGDGKADIVAILPAPTDDNGDPIGSGTLTIYFGNGDGTFRAQAPIDLEGDEVQPSLLVADVNHDGKPDILTVSGDQYGDNYLQTFLNQGGGKFKAGPTYATVLTEGAVLASADFNGDGNADLVVENNYETQILLGKGNGSFTAGATYNADPLFAGVGDLNRDHQQDLVIVTPTNTRILLGKGDGTFSSGPTLNTEYIPPVSGFGITVVPTGLYVGDLNQDGIPDVVVTTASSAVAASIYYGKGNGTFTDPKAFNISQPFGSSAGPTAFADFNRDGRTDVVAMSAGAGYVIAYGSNDGGFDAPVIAGSQRAGNRQG